MGLDAVVYRRLEEVPFPSDSDLSSVRVDELTGEVHFENAEAAVTRREDVVAIKKRLGNMALIAVLYKEISRVLGRSSPPSMLLSKVLYDGTHSGDVIPVEELDRLKHEICLVREKAHSQGSHELEEFLSRIEELITASERQGNPIVFV
jgi:hypothetical protein